MGATVVAAPPLEQLFAQVIDQLPMPVLAADDAGRLLMWNEAAAVQLGPVLASRTVEGLEAEAYTDDKRRRFVTAPGRGVNGERFTWIVGIDGADDQRLVDAFAHQALHDHLTGLPNRTLLDDRLGQALSRASRPGNAVSVMFLDLDQFKVINDTQGHAVGDALLQAIAERLLESVRPGDTVARFGGDEFVVICEGLAGESEAEMMGQRLCRAIEAPVRVHNDEIYVTASLGIAVGRSDDTPDSLLRDADAAMYHAKAKGRARAELFSTDIRRRAERRRATEGALRRALEERQLRLAYQPIVDLEAGWIVGAEALLRWDHPTRGEISPVEFIPIAEDTGLIQPVGAWVIEEACRQLRAWRSEFPHVPLFVSINISPRQLRAPIIQTISDAVRHHDLDASNVVLEITERVLMDDESHYLEILQALHSTGIKLALDDFGAGHSSLTYLRQFPIDILKVDRAFIDGLGTEPHDSAIVAAIVGMARGLKVSLVAEGVETAQQLNALRHLGCQQAQGFHLATPLAPHAFGTLLRERRRW